MIRTILWAAFCAAMHSAVLAKPLETLPANVLARLDAIRQFAAKEDWASVRKEYDLMDWAQVKYPAPVLKEISRELKGSKAAKALRKEVKTKYNLVREYDDVELPDDVETIAIPIHRFPRLRLTWLVIQGLKVVTLALDPLALVTVEMDPLNVITLGFDGLTVTMDKTAIIVICIKDKRFIAAIEKWEHIYGIALDAVGVDNYRYLPHPATTLGLKRTKLIKDLTKYGWTADTEKQWSEYYAELAKMFKRRELLNRKRE